MEHIVTSCKECGTILGHFANLWIKIGKSYISPMVKVDGDLHLTPIGPFRVGEKQTLVGECRLQDVACSRCGTTVGLTCLQTPVNHILQEGQIMLRSSSIVTSAGDGETEKELNIQRTLKLRGSSRNPDDHSSPSRYDHPDGVPDGTQVGAGSNAIGVGLGDLQADLDIQRQEIQRIDTAGYQIVTALDSAVLRIEKEVAKLHNGMIDLQGELDGQKKQSVTAEDLALLKTEVQEATRLSRDTSNFTRLENEIASATRSIFDAKNELTGELDGTSESLRLEQESTNSELAETRRELRSLREELGTANIVARDGIAMARGYAKEVTTLRRELAQIKEEAGRDRPRHPPPAASAFSTQDLDIITSNITTIGNRASQIESLQMEFQLLKGRLQRLEARGASEESYPASFTQLTTQNIHMERPVSEQSRKRGTRDRHVEGIVDLGSPFTSPRMKRRALPKSSSSPAQNYDPISSLPSLSPVKAEARQSDSPRLTKAGTIDKRGLKRK